MFLDIFEYFGYFWTIWTGLDIFNNLDRIGHFGQDWTIGHFWTIWIFLDKLDSFDSFDNFDISDKIGQLNKIVKTEKQIPRYLEPLAGFFFCSSFKKNLSGTYK